MNAAAMTTPNLLNAYRRNETWRTYTMQDECTRMHRQQVMGEEIQRRGLELPEPRNCDWED